MDQNKSAPRTTPVPPPNDLMRMGMAAAYLGCSVTTMYRAIANQGLPARRMGGRWVFSKTELDAWVRALPGVNIPTVS